LSAVAYNQKMANTKKQLGRKVVLRERLRKAPHQTALRKTYGPLIEWVAFANGETESISDSALTDWQWSEICDCGGGTFHLKREHKQGMRRFKDSVTGAPIEIIPIAITIRREGDSQLRAWALGFLREVATVVKQGGGGIKEPRPEPTLVIKGNRLKEERGEYEGKTALLHAMKDRDLDRLRLCSCCSKLFVALNDRTKTCGIVCSNLQSGRAYYKRHRKDQQKRKREEYWAKILETQRRA
jgi:hypothetical protein